jgi:hypothetical protein
MDNSLFYYSKYEKYSTLNHQDIETFHFRSLHSNIYLGTTSDRYAGGDFSVGLFDLLNKESMATC